MQSVSTLSIPFAGLTSTTGTIVAWGDSQVNSRPYFLAQIRWSQERETSGISRELLTNPMRGACVAHRAYRMVSGYDFVGEAAFDEGVSGLETSSIATNSAPSPIRRRVFTILVYPPGRSLNRAATSLNSLETTSLLRRKLSARRRAGNDPSLPSVIMRSVNPRISLALASVVSIRSCSRSEVTRLLNNAHRCLVCRPSCLPFFL